MLSLNETKAGEDYTVKWMTGMPETMDYIRSCKVSEGEDVHVISRIFGGVIVGVEDRRILSPDQVLSGCKAGVLTKKRNNLWAFFNLLP